jgi:DNA (cytosine-5)-methyltransferase 1
MTAYYNEIDGAAAHVLESLIEAGTIANGIVDRRSIRDVRPADLDGFTQCHFFAGAGLWSVAARLAGWPDDKPLWTGSCPCQPFSVAGKGAGIDDVRHLWPDFFRLIRAARPPVVVGEQVAGKAGRGWFHGVRSDLEGGGYAGRAVDIPALAVDAPHIRQRLYWIAVADAGREGRLSAAHSGICGQAQGERPRHVEPERHFELHGGSLADTDRGGCARRSSVEIGSARSRTALEGHDESGGVTLGDAFGSGLEGFGRHGDGRDGRQGSARSASTADGRNVADADMQRRGEARELRQGSIPEFGGRHGANGSYWSDAEWLTCHDGKARRSKPGLRLLVDGMAGRTDLWRIAGNSIVPQLAAEVLRSFLETEGIAA